MPITLIHIAVLAGAVGVDVPTFRDATDDVGLTWTHTSTVDSGEKHWMTPGVGVGDFDRDGALDLFVAGGVGQNAALFMNDGAGRFTDEALARGIDMTDVDGASVTVADFDGNGWLDVYAGTLDTRNRLYMNLGGATFVETGATSGATLVDGLPFNTFSATAGDVDGDGDLDLVTTEWRLIVSTGNLLFAGNGDGTFVERTAESGLFSGVEDPLTWGFTATLIDMDGDRTLDLPVAADFGSSQYYTNTGGGLFQRLIGNGTCTDENGMGVAIADYDNDGDPDWFVTSIYDDDGTVEGGWGTTGNRLYRNDGAHVYTDVTDAAGVRDGGWGWGTSFGDVDHDGRLDLTMTNGFFLPFGLNPDPTFETDPTRLWMNTGDVTTGPTFVEVAAAAGIEHTGAGKGLVMLDADRDGDLDIVITTNRGALAYFRNDTKRSPSTWLQVDVVAPPGHPPDGIGAKIELTVGGATYHRWVHGAQSFMSQGPLRVHFGFPAAATIDTLAVHWAGGTSSVWEDLAPGRIVRLRVADLDADGTVGIADLEALITRWGACAAPCIGDIDSNGSVGFADLMSMIAGWG